MGFSLSRFGEAQANAAVRGEAANGIATQWQWNAALEPSLRQFEAVDPGIAEFRRQHAAPAHDECALVDYGFDIVGIDARQSDQYQHLTVGLQHIDGRLPAWLVSASARPQFQELLVQSFGTSKRFDRVGQHPVDGILGRHFVTPAIGFQKVSQFLRLPNAGAEAWIVF
jgi:hypothetical protein